MLDVVASHKHQLSLPVEAEGVHEAESRLSGSPAGNTQPMGESEPVQDREHDEGRNAASCEESDLKDPILRERKLIQPLHTRPKTSAAKRSKESLFKFANRTTV